MAVMRLGQQPYLDVLELQRKLAAERARNARPDTLVVVEHEPVFTLGRRRSSRDNVLVPGDTPVVQVERGGDVTWHGPGQLVAYPVFMLRPDERDLHEVLRKLEQTIIDTLDDVGVPAARRDGFTGVWSDGKKVASLGIAVNAGWVTTHGLALNVNCDLSGFARINPCGLDADVMTRLVDLTSALPSWLELENLLVAHIAHHFDRRIIALL